MLGGKRRRVSLTTGWWRRRAPGGVDAWADTGVLVVIWGDFWTRSSRLAFDLVMPRPSGPPWSRLWCVFTDRGTLKPRQRRALSAFPRMFLSLLLLIFMTNINLLVKKPPDNSVPTRIHPLTILHGNLDLLCEADEQNWETRFLRSKKRPVLSRWPVLSRAAGRCVCLLHQHLHSPALFLKGSLEESRILALAANVNRILFKKDLWCKIVIFFVFTSVLFHLKLHKSQLRVLLAFCSVMEKGRMTGTMTGRWGHAASLTSTQKHLF